MKRPLRIGEHGLSLVELLLGLAIAALMLAPLVPMHATASAAARIAGDQLAVEREADFALERISARIRATTTPAQLIGSSCDQDPLTPGLYEVINGVLKEKQGEVRYVLADSVTCLTLTSVSSSREQTLVQVSLTLARNEARTVATAVVPLGVTP